MVSNKTKQLKNMFNSTLEIIIKARDEASQVISGMTNKMKEFEPAFKTMAIAGTAAFATIAAVAGDSIKKASDWQDKINQLNAVLESTGGVAGVTKDQALELANAMQKLTTYDDDAVLSTENLLLTFTKIGKDIFPQATQTTLDMATALGEDTKSAAIQLGKALQDPILGVTALRRVGVNFSADQKEVIKQLVETGKSAEAQQLILKELNTEFGGSAAAATQSFGGQLKQVKNSIDDMEKSLGTALIPVLLKVVETIKPIVEKMTEWIEAHPKLTQNIILVVGAIAGLLAIFGTLGLAFSTISTVFEIFTTVSYALGIALEFLALNPVGLIIMAIAGLIILGIALYKNWDVVKEKAIEIWTAVKNFFSNLWADIKNIFKEAIDAVVAFFQPLIDIINTVINLISKVTSSIGSVVTAAGGKVSSAFTALTSPITGKKAQGGPVSGGSTYLVGENGPELFTASQGGSITPNNRLGGVSGGIVINVTGTFLSEDAAEKVGNMIVQQLKRVSRVGV